MFPGGPRSAGSDTAGRTGFEVIVMLTEQNRTEGRIDFSLLQVGVFVWLMQV